MRHYYGRLELICGSMFCGKTEELIRRVRRATIAKQQVQVFKPQIDDRYGLENITSHNGQKIEAIPVAKSTEILNQLQSGTTVIAIDEVQFMDSSIVRVVEQLAQRKIRVIMAGLDQDFRGEPFGSVPEIMARAEEVMKLQAICMECGEPASRTQRLVNGKPAHYNDPVIMVGAKEKYEPRCRQHHDVPGHPILEEELVQSHNN